MPSTSLTAERAALPGGGTAVPYGPDRVLVRDDAMTALAIWERLSSEGGMPRGDVMAALFPDPAEAYAAADYDDAALDRLAADAMWDVLGIDVTGAHAGETSGERLWDPVEDAARIRSSFRAAYGIDWDSERDGIQWGDFLALVAGIPRDTPLGTAMHYRNPKTKPRATRHNAEERAAWDRAHAFYRLGATRAGAAASDMAMTDAFRSIADASMRAGR